MSGSFSIICKKKYFHYIDFINELVPIMKASLNCMETTCVKCSLKKTHSVYLHYIINAQLHNYEENDRPEISNNCFSFKKTYTDHIYDHPHIYSDTYY